MLQRIPLPAISSSSIEEFEAQLEQQVYRFGYDISRQHSKKSAAGLEPSTPHVTTAIRQWHHFAGVLKSSHFECPRAGLPLRSLKVDDISKRRNRLSMRCNCPFDIYATIADGTVDVRVRSLGHNHPPRASDAAVVGHPHMLDAEDLQALIELRQAQAKPWKVVQKGVQLLSAKLGVPVVVCSCAHDVPLPATMTLSRIVYELIYMSYSLARGS